MLSFGSSGFFNREQRPGTDPGGSSSIPGADREVDRTQSGRRTDTPSGTGAEHVGEVVQQMAGSTGGPAAAAAEIAETATALSGADALHGSRSDEGVPGPGIGDASVDGPLADGTTGAEHAEPAPARGAPHGQVLATEPSVGKYRPERDNPNPLVARPADRSETQPVLETALAKARNMPPPPIEAAHAAFRSLHPDLQQRMRQAYDGGGANAVRLEAARRSTSDLISNAQAADLMMVARASEHGMVHTLLGLEAPQPEAATPASMPSTERGGPVSSGTTAGHAEASTPAPPQVSEHSPLAAERDEAWRKAGPGAQPHTD